MFLSLVTSTLLNKTGAGVVFWPREEWHSLVTKRIFMVLWSSLGPCGDLVGQRHPPLRFTVSEAMEQLCCSPSSWFFRSVKLRVSTFGELWHPARGARHP